MELEQCGKRRETVPTPYKYLSTLNHIGSFISIDITRRVEGRSVHSEVEASRVLIWDLQYR